MPVAIDADRLAELAGHVRDLRWAIEDAWTSEISRYSEDVTLSASRANVPDEIDAMIEHLTLGIMEANKKATPLDRKCMMAVANCIEDLVELACG